MANRRGCLAELNNCATHLELLFRFWSWASEMRCVPQPEEIINQFSVTVATAYRWRNAWCDATGRPIPEKRPPGTRSASVRAYQMDRYHKRKQTPRETSSPAATGTPSNPSSRTPK